MNTALASIRHLIKQTEMNEEEIVQCKIFDQNIYELRITTTTINK